MDICAGKPPSGAEKRRDGQLFWETPLGEQQSSSLLGNSLSKEEWNPGIMALRGTILPNPAGTHSPTRRQLQVCSDFLTQYFFLITVLVA